MKLNFKCHKNIRKKNHLNKTQQDKVIPVYQKLQKIY